MEERESIRIFDFMEKKKRGKNKLILSKFE